MSEKHPHLVGFMYDFYGKSGRWPTWSDAMAHCTPEMQAQWTTALGEMGIAVNQTTQPKEDNEND
jgi:hypothetical protein